MIKLKTSVKTLKEKESTLFEKIDAVHKKILTKFTKNDIWYKVLKDCYLGIAPKDVDKLVCKECGALNRHYNMDFCCRTCLYSYNMKTHGKKRPNHSKQMIKHFRDGKYEEFRKSTNKNINSDSFKKARLDNHGINYDDDNFEMLYNELLRDVQIGPNHWKKTLLNSINYQDWKSHDEYYLIKYDKLTTRLISEMNDGELRKWFARYNSLKTVIAYKNNPTMGRTSASRLFDLKYNIRGLTSIYVRSSYEVNWIQYFENNEIEWDYESVRISDGNIIYVPDFFIMKEGKRYIIEVKGFVPETWVDIIYEKSLLGVDYAKKHDLKYCFTYDSTPKSHKKYFDEISLNDRSNKEIRLLIKDKNA